MKKVNDAENVLVDTDVLMPDGLVPSYEVKSCADIVRMYKNGQLEIQPDFQRNFVWKPTVQTLFIDSLVKRLPIPSLFIGLDYRTNKHIVIDGLQRISTIIKFFEEDKWRLSKLPDIDERISGKKVKEIKKNDLFSKVENLSIPVTIIRFDFLNQNSMDSLFTIFHRLNVGGQKLNNQEIRNCIYSGKFNAMLKKVTQSGLWTDNLGKASKLDRLETEEILLRVFAFSDKLDDYAGRLGKFLNSYMTEVKDMGDEGLQDKEDAIETALFIIKNKIDMPEKLFKLGKTLKEGLLVGLIANISTLVNKSDNEVKEMFNNFINDELFSDASLRQGLAKKDKVQSRLKKSIQIFSGQ
jgi:hypothetical protein